MLGVNVQTQVGLNVPTQWLHNFGHHRGPKGVSVIHEKWLRVTVQHNLAQSDGGKTDKSRGKSRYELKQKFRKQVNFVTD